MFETCMVESAGLLKSRNTKWTTAGAFALEGTLLALVVVATMIQTDLLPKTAGIIHITPPYAPPRATQVVATERHAATTRSDAMTVPTKWPEHARPFVDPSSQEPAEPLPPGFIPGPNTHNPIIDVIASTTNPPIVHAQPPKRMIISTMDPAKLVRQVKPVYPRMAVIAGIQGTVVLHAIIGKDGSIQNLEVMSGHPMLRAAAEVAVLQWRYKPTYLGGQAVEVETSINVNFRLGER